MRLVEMFMERSIFEQLHVGDAFVIATFSGVLCGSPLFTIVSIEQHRERHSVHATAGVDITAISQWGVTWSASIYAVAFDGISNLRLHPDRTVHVVAHA